MTVGVIPVEWVWRRDGVGPCHAQVEVAYWLRGGVGLVVCLDGGSLWEPPRCQDLHSQPPHLPISLSSRFHTALIWLKQGSGGELDPVLPNEVSINWHCGGLLRTDLPGQEMRNLPRLVVGFPALMYRRVSSQASEMLCVIVCDGVKHCSRH